MADLLTQEALDQHAEKISDLLDDLPWCECISFLEIGGDDVDSEANLQDLLQVFEVAVFDGYVTDFIRMVRRLDQQLLPLIQGHKFHLKLIVPYHKGDDPNHVPLYLICNNDGNEDEALSSRKAFLDAFDGIVREAIEEWSQEEEEEESVESLV